MEQIFLDKRTWAKNDGVDYLNIHILAQTGSQSLHKVLRRAATATNKDPAATFKTVGEGVGSSCKLFLVSVIPVCLIHILLYLS
jgi:hypothetical protein